MYAYNVHVHRYVKVFYFSLMLNQTPPTLRTVLTKRANLLTDNDMTSRMYARLNSLKALQKYDKKLNRT